MTRAGKRRDQTYNGIEKCNSLVFIFNVNNEVLLVKIIWGLPALVWNVTQLSFSLKKWVVINFTNTGTLNQPPFILEFKFNSFYHARFFMSIRWCSHSCKLQICFRQIGYHSSRAASILRNLYTVFNQTNVSISSLLIERGWACLYESLQSNSHLKKDGLFFSLSFVGTSRRLIPECDYFTFFKDYRGGTM